MADPKKYWYIQLNVNFFENDVIDWICEQKNGYQYIVLYLKLCLKTANNNGILTRKIGDMIIPYDAKKISEITKMDIDTVIVALELFKKVGLVYESDEFSRCLTLPAVPEMVGYTTQWALYKSKQRAKAKQIEDSKIGQCPKNVQDNVQQEKELRVKSNSNNKSNTPPISPKGIDTRFEKFWDAYPRKVGKGAAEKSFKKYKPDDNLLATMISAIAEQKQSDQWQKDGGQFIPNPSTWLNQKRWEDEIPQPKPTKQNKSAETGSNSSLDMDKVSRILHGGAEID